MSKWVDADALKANINTTFWSEIDKILDSAPSTDIVLCKECVNNDINCRGTENWCLHFGYDVEDDDFCSYGERRE